MGIGIWSMHFIGMLALRLPIPMSYDIPVTLASLLIAIVVSGFALHTASHSALGLRRLLVAGVLMGLGIASMHYVGMAAMDMQPPIRYEPLLFTLSIAIAIGASIAALWIAFQLHSGASRKGFAVRSASALIMGAAIAGMHYTGMAAAVFAPDSICTVSPQEINNAWLAGTIGVFAFMLLATTTVISMFDARLADRSARLADTLRNANAALEKHAAELSAANARLQQEAEERMQAEQALRESEERYRDLTELSSDWYWELDQDYRFTMLSGGISKLAGISLERLIGKNPRELPGVLLTREEWVAHDSALLAREPFHDFVYRFAGPDGRPRHVNTSARPIFDADGRFRGYRGVGKDITERVLAEERIQYLAYHDGLTDLPNRAMFSRILGHAIEHARRYDRKLAVLFIDLDRFKNINDTFGHEAGDTLLQETGRRLKGCVRNSDTVARLGGDEFVVLLDELREAAEAGVVANKILSSIIRPFQMFGQEFRVTASIGVSAYPGDGQDEQSLMKNADIAMYQAKAEGKNTHQFYSESMNAHSYQRLTLESNLRRAMELEEFRVHYQPKVDLRSGTVTGMEALLRWEHPDFGMVPPVQFIPIAEETGLIVQLGRWILREACRQNVRWQQQGLPALCVAVNLSPRQFADSGLLADIGSVLAETGMDPRYLELEITESMVMINVEKALDILTGLKGMGVRLAIDDFGTGYSSLSNLKRFPLDTIKIDRSFIRDIPGDPEDMAITQAIIGLGRTLKLTVIAEGVETQEQAGFLRQHDCDEFQGYLFSKPVD
ncbi:MAG: EAL domain-containing protein, partial [Gammaproteobacteria bacterium]